jgi:ABC-type transport system involved in multi-copper enzyme maturation permease subunit
MSARPMNPVLARELKERMRGRRAPIVLTVYLLILAGILELVYQTRAGSHVASFGAPVATEVASVGRTIFEWLVFVMLLLVIFLVPGFTSGAIAGERERQTLVPLQVTMLRPVSIVLGKIGASMAFLALLIVAALPLLSVSYLIGGVTVWEVVRATAAVLVTGVVLACLTVTVSALVRRVQAATVVAYAVTLALVLGTFMVWGAANLVDASRGSDPANAPAQLLLLNPIVATADLIGQGSSNGSSVSSPFRALKDMLDRTRNQSGQVFPTNGGGVAIAVGGSGGNFIAPSPPVIVDRNGNPVFADTTHESGFPFWLQSALLLGALSALGVWLAARRLRTPSDAER